MSFVKDLSEAYGLPVVSFVSVFYLILFDLGGVRYLCGNAQWPLVLEEPGLFSVWRNDTGYPHDGRADKDSYPHNGRADKDSYPHDRHNQYIMLSL